MNGAELPCGSVIRVEPADSSFSSRQTSHPYGPQEPDQEKTLSQGDDAQGERAAPTSADPPADSDDLDDFFDSL